MNPAAGVPTAGAVPMRLARLLIRRHVDYGIVHPQRFGDLGLGQLYEALVLVALLHIAEEAESEVGV